MAHKKTTVTFDGIEEFEDALNEIGVRCGGVAKYTLYHFSDVIADAVQDQISALPTMTEEQRREAVKNGHKFDPTPEQKEGLISGMRGGSPGHFGITTHKMSGLDAFDYVTFAGYNSRKNKGYWRRDIHGKSYYVPVEKQEYGYPNGEPNIAVADWVNAGTRSYKAHHFAQAALNASFDKAREAGIEAMDDIIHRIIDKHIK